MLDMWSLKVLVEVGRLGSFSAAAEELSMTQPAVSRQIATLERHTGVRLFERLPRGVRPTDAGRAALEQADEVLRGLRLFETRMRAFATAEAGRVRVSAFPSAATSYLPDRFRSFAARHPDVELSLTVRSGEHDPCAAVLDGETDIALLTSWDMSGPSGTAGMPGVALTPLHEDELLVALAVSHPLAKRSRVRLRDLAADPWIDGTHPDCLGPIAQLAAALGRAPRISHVCDDWNGRQGLVAAGVGVMLYPSIAGYATARPDIRLLRPSPPLPSRTILAATLPPTDRPPAVSAFLSTLTSRPTDPVR
ncbi:LysR family transcriptional regulator [Nonomuraea turcica]|uniref:LysR family transcriptional regulator n=1 Tax=Nonomuraea sp. G32 TaxID=3067274 RepID=UPI00273CA2D9|nr:LysR family transcriptional regulator [Nonomuraea sp. G32]MDP4506278.1 LysR family transcriptional regulator [Nonomuraea sp. G32]